MNQSPKPALPQGGHGACPHDFEAERANVERELRLSKEYLLRTIYPYVKGRALHGIEFFVAVDANRRLQRAKIDADDWNKRCEAANDGLHEPVTVDVDLSAAEFCEPEKPKMLFAENLTPQMLAQVAAPLMNNGKAIAPEEAIRNAHGLLIAAERYIGTLPEKSESQDGWSADFAVAFSHVSFAEIVESNKMESGRLPLLPTLQGSSKTGDNSLSLKQIRAEVKRFLQRQVSLTPEEYEQAAQQDESLVSGGHMTRFGQSVDYDEWMARNYAAVDGCLKNSRISVQDLCTLRWERFKQFALKQRTRAIGRNSNAKKLAFKRSKTVSKRK